MYFLMKFSHKFFVNRADIDEQGHVNNVVYVRWIQNVAVAHWFSATTELEREKYVWMVTRHEIDYKKQAFENEKVIVTTWVGEPTRISWERFTEIRRSEDLLVKARSVWCLIDRETLKPMRITEQLKNLFSNRSN